MNQATGKQIEQHSLSGSSSSSASVSNSISLIRLDELSPFGATKNNRLPALIKLTDKAELLESIRQPNSMPTYSANQIELASTEEPKQQSSLPANLGVPQSQDKENLSLNKLGEANSLIEDYQVIDMVVASEPELVGPSLPQPKIQPSVEQSSNKTLTQVNREQLASLHQQHPSTLGDSLIDMVINLKNENQNLVRALETNNEYVKERLSEFKRVAEESKRREAQFALEKAEHEHQVRKLQRQNTVLSERLKSMEAKLKDMKLEVSESLDAARSSKASSIQPPAGELYPSLGDDETFSNPAAAYNQTPTLQVADAPMDTNSAEERDDPLKGLSKEELSKRFDADKAEFYALSNDPLKQCDKLEQQLNEIGRRDYEICLLQQQLNIYRQDYRLERMANLEAKIQIEKLKNDIDRLCLDRLNEKNRSQAHPAETGSGPSQSNLAGPANAAIAAADAVLGRLGHQLSKKAARSAAKAAKYAAKQAHREEKISAAAAAAAAASAASGSAGQTSDQYSHGRRHHHHRHHSHRSSIGGIKNEVVSDLLSTANKAMLTGYKMASTHVNLALDKLSQFEQNQANQLAKNQQNTSAKLVEPSAPAQSMQPPSID